MSTVERSARGPRRVLDYETALGAARRKFLASGNVDMEAMAHDLAVSRATLYRVVGNRDRLLGDIIWSMAERTLELAIAETGESLKGVEWVVEMSRRFNELVNESVPLRTFLHNEPLTAFRVLFTPAGGVHERAVETWRELLLDTVERDGIQLPFDADRVAYVLVRVGESMLYSDLISSRDPDIELAAFVHRAILTSVPLEQAAIEQHPFGRS